MKKIFVCGFHQESNTFNPKLAGQDCFDIFEAEEVNGKNGKLPLIFKGIFEAIGKFKSDKHNYLERYGRWLYIDTNLVTIDGFRYQFRKGFVGTVKRIVKDGKATDTYNIPLEILRKEKPKVFNGYLVNRENKKEWAIRVSDRAFSWLYDEIDFVDDNYMLIREGDKLHLTYFTSLEIRPVYSLITKPVNGKYFAVKKNEDDNCEVDFLDVDDTIFPIVAIPSCSYEDLLQYLKAGKLLITQTNNGDNKNIWKIPDPSIFDKDFLEQFPLKKDEMASYRDDKVYWYPKM